MILGVNFLLRVSQPEIPLCGHPCLEKIFFSLKRREEGNYLSESCASEDGSTHMVNGFLIEYRDK